MVQEIWTPFGIKKKEVKFKSTLSDSLLNLDIPNWNL